MPTFRSMPVFRILMLLLAGMLVTPLCAQVTGFGISAWDNTTFFGGATMSYSRDVSYGYLGVDWGYRWGTADTLYGIVRVETGMPVLRWGSGMLGAGPSATWYWTKDEDEFDDALDWLEMTSGEPDPALHYYDDPYDDDDDDDFGTWLAKVLLLSLAVGAYATGDALLSPLTSEGESGRGIRLRPCVTLHQHLSDSMVLRISHDFADEPDDFFSGTTVSVIFSR